MDLYYTQSSPYAHCVRMVIAEIGIENQINLIESHPFDNDKDFLAANPLAKVPCLVDNGETIVDSEVICDYLDANYTGGELFNPIYADWRLKSFYSMVTGLIDVSVARQMERGREKDGLLSDFWWQRQSLAIERTLLEIERRLTLLPESISILQLALLSALAYLDFRHPDIEWRKNHAGLAVFFKTFSQRACFQNHLLQG